MRQETESDVVVGITDYAQDRLGSIVFVELPEVGFEVRAGENMAVIESVKAVADTYSPVDGTVTEINEKLLEQPELLNEDPYGEGWMVKINIREGRETAGLLKADEYGEFILQEEGGEA